MKHHKHHGHHGHHKHHGHDGHHGGHHGHHSGHHKHHSHHAHHASNPYPGLPAHRMQYGDDIYCYNNEGHVEKPIHTVMGQNPKWMGK